MIASLQTKANRQADTAWQRLTRLGDRAQIYISKHGNILLSDPDKNLPAGSTFVGVYDPGVPLAWLYGDLCAAHEQRAVARGAPTLVLPCGAGRTRRHITGAGGANVNVVMDTTVTLKLAK